MLAGWVYETRRENLPINELLQQQKDATCAQPIFL